MANILFADRAEAWDEYAPHLRASLDAHGLPYDLRPDFAPEEVDYIVYAPSSTVQDFTPYTRLKAVLNLWAGVEQVIGNETLKVPLTRMVDPGMTEGMVQWVVAHVMRHHMDLDTFTHGQDGEWRVAPTIQPLMSQRHVTVLGLGELGGACAQALATLGFKVSGWSRSAKSIPGVTAHKGPDGLETALGTAEIVVLLTPFTSKTENLLNAQTLAMLPKGAVIVNPGRGGLIDDDALLAALDRDHIGHATLDVFRVEPLPRDHRFWSHPRVTVTPHIASQTRADTAAQVIADNIARAESGQPLHHLVDRSDR